MSECEALGCHHGRIPFRNGGHDDDAMLVGSQVIVADGVLRFFFSFLSFCFWVLRN